MPHFVVDGLMVDGFRCRYRWRGGGDLLFHCDHLLLLVLVVVHLCALGQLAVPGRAQPLFDRPRHAVRWVVCLRHGLHVLLQSVSIHDPIKVRRTAQFKHLIISVCNFFFRKTIITTMSNQSQHAFEIALSIFHITFISIQKMSKNIPLPTFYVKYH